MTAYADIAVAVLAAGQARRFGSDKLMAELEGKPMGLHIVQTLEPMAFGWRFAVCSKGAALMQYFSTAGFEIVTNNQPEAGQAHSVHLAVNAAQATDATSLLVVLADMPFVSANHLAALVTNYDDDIVASTDGHARMPPAIFPQKTWPMLLATTGDAGARGLLKNAKLFAAPAAELRDIDTIADLPASK